MGGIWLFPHAYLFMPEISYDDADFRICEFESQGYLLCVPYHGPLFGVSDSYFFGG